jgi:hypothetical protein
MPDDELRKASARALQIRLSDYLNRRLTPRKFLARNLLRGNVDALIRRGTPQCPSLSILYVNYRPASAICAAIR